MNASYITLDELKNTYLAGLDLSDINDAALTSQINVASRWVDSITNANKGWEQEIITDEEYDSTTSCHTDSDGNLHIYLEKRPLDLITDVSAIKIKLGAYQTSLVLSSGGISVISNPDPGWEIIYPNTWLIQTGTLLSNQRLYQLRSFRYFILLTYKAGYATIPEDIKFATALVVQQNLSTRFNPTAAESVRQGSMSMSWGKGKIGDESPLISQAKIYLRNYIRVV